MQLEKIALPDTRTFSTFFLDYIQGSDKLKSFYGLFPSADNAWAQLKIKSSFPDASRRTLVESLQRQYGDITLTDAVKNNIAALSSPKTFTITTGHQLNLFTGPLYFIYKIITVVNTCKVLHEQYPDYQFVPVYWMASEDHDFEEISYFRLYGITHQWRTTQSGAVGRFDPHELKPLLDEIPGDIGIFRDAYLKNKTLSDAVRHYVHSLFGATGLVVIDADDRDLKRQLTGVMEEDLFEHAPERLVAGQNTALENLGYHPQVHARDINFFYLDKGRRDRIEQDGDGFKAGDQRFTKDGIGTLIREEPEHFSPNVILRPLYQEMILPNLAYAGGPAEVVYWLQLKKVFDHFNVAFPMIMPRNFAVVMDAPLTRKFQKTGLELKDFFEEKNYLFNHWILRNTHHDLTLTDSIAAMRQTFDTILARATQLDVTLAPMVNAEVKRTQNHLERIEKKMLKAEKRRHGEKLRQIEVVKDALFPGGNLQERTDNFLNFYQQDTHFIQALLDAFNPFDFRLHALLYA
jgi:bacillithiol biosynthesis cysteine-adding enzyme BshC